MGRCFPQHVKLLERQPPSLGISIANPELRPRLADHRRVTYRQARIILGRAQKHTLRYINQPRILGIVSRLRVFTGRKHEAGKCAFIDFSLKHSFLFCASFSACCIVTLMFFIKTKLFLAFWYFGHFCLQSSRHCINGKLFRIFLLQPPN